MSLKPQLLAICSGELAPSQPLPKCGTSGIGLRRGIVAAGQLGSDPGEVGLGVAGRIEFSTTARSETSHVKSDGGQLMLGLPAPHC